MSFARLARVVLLSILVIVATWIGEAPKPVKADTMYSISFRNIDESLQKVMISSTFGNAGLSKSASDSSDIIMEIAGENRDGYDKKRVGYSPVVAIFPEKFEDKLSDNFHCYTGTNGKYYMTNMKNVINHIINSKDGVINTKTIGYTAAVEAKLGIPDAGSIDRKAVIDSLIYLITDGQDVTEENKQEVKEKLSSLLSKSINVMNINYETLTSNNDFILMVPEYRLKLAESAYNYPIYWEDACAVELNMQFKDSVTAENKEEIINKVSGASAVFKKANIRNNWAVDVNSYTLFAESIKVRYTQDNLEELLGSNYWK